MFGKRKIPKEERELRAFLSYFTEDERYEMLNEYIEKLARENDAQNFTVLRLREIYRIGCCYTDHPCDVLDMMAYKFDVDPGWLYVSVLTG